MTLFKKMNFTSAARLKLTWKIECDAFTQEDWECIAYVGAKSLPPFSRVIGVPNGGLKLAEAFRPLCKGNSYPDLIVDDVWTTGKSLYEVAGDDHDFDWLGFVAFSRSTLPSYVKCMWQLGG